MARRPVKPLQPSREERRAFLAECFTEAVEPMLEAGETYSALSVERLITAVDISRSTFYAYFDDKGDLLGAMTESVTNDLAEAGAVWFDLPPSATREDLRRALETLFAVYRRHKTLLRAITEAAGYDARVRAGRGALVERAVTGLQEHIERHQAAGTVAPELDPAYTARWLVWMLERGLDQFAGHAPEPEVNAALECITDLVWRGLYEGHAPAALRSRTA